MLARDRGQTSSSTAKGSAALSHLLLSLSLLFPSSRRICRCIVFGTLVVVGVAVLAGCQPPESAAELEQQGTESSTSGSAPRSPERPAPPPLVENGAVRELVGEYRLAGVDGQNIDLPHGISAVITTDRIEIAAGCVRFAWSYQFDGGNLATKSLPAASCKRGLYPEEEAVKRAFDAAERVERTPANGILLSGDGHSVTIFSQ